MSVVIFSKSWTGERYELPANHSLIGQIAMAAARAGYTIDEGEPTVVEDVDKAAAPAGAVVEVRKGGSKMGFKEVLKAAERGEIDKVALAAAVTRKAQKEYPNAASGEIAFAKYIQANPGLRQVIDAAPPVVAPAPRSSFEAIARSAADFCKKQGTSLPPGSPYAAYLAKSGDNDSGGERDGVDGNYKSEADKAIDAIADSLVKAGRFTERSIARRFMANSPAYSGLFTAFPKYKEQVRSMLEGHLP